MFFFLTIGPVPAPLCPLSAPRNDTGQEGFRVRSWCVAAAGQDLARYKQRVCAAVAASTSAPPATINAMVVENRMPHLAQIEVSDARLA